MQAFKDDQEEPTTLCCPALSFLHWETQQHARKVTKQQAVAVVTVVMASRSSVATSVCANVKQRHIAPLVLCVALYAIFSWEPHHTHTHTQRRRYIKHDASKEIDKARIYTKRTISKMEYGQSRN